MTLPLPVDDRPEWLRRQTAVHEAAHAIMARDAGWDVRFLEISDAPVSDRGAARWAVTRVTRPARPDHLDVVVFSLAGHVAEWVCCPQLADDYLVDDALEHLCQLRDADGIIPGEDLADAYEALELLLDLPADRDCSETETAFAWAVLRTERLVRAERGRIERLADQVERLEPGGRLDGDRLTALLGVAVAD